MFENNIDEDHDQNNIIIDAFIHNFLQWQNIHDHENAITSISPSENNHNFSYFKDKYSEELNFPPLFYGLPCDSKIYKNFSYTQIV